MSSASAWLLIRSTRVRCAYSALYSTLLRSSVWRSREPGPAAIVLVQPPVAKCASASGHVSPVAVGKSSGQRYFSRWCGTRAARCW